MSNNLAEIDRRKVLKSIAATGTLASVGIGSAERKNSTDSKSLSGDKKEQAVQDAFSDSKTRRIIEKLEADGWEINNSNSIALHIIYNDVRYIEGLEYTGVDENKAVIIPAEKELTNDEAAVVWNSVQWAEDIPRVAGYRLIRTDHSISGGTPEQPVEVKALETYSYPESEIKVNRDKALKSKERRTIHPSSSCDCEKAVDMDVNFTCALALSTGWAATLLTCAACGTGNVGSCLLCPQAVAAQGGSVAECDGEAEFGCVSFDDLTTRQYEYRCEICLNLDC